jgi:SAM-dependent methyltransferase
VESWLLDEPALAGPEHLDSAAVERYDRKADVDAEPEVALLRERGLDERSTVVDLGAGTGTFAFAAAPFAGRVVAVDVSPAMVAAMRAKTASLENVECVEAGFLTYRHEGDLADIVYSRNVLHHLPDFWKAIALLRIASILRPGGILRLRDIVYSFDAGQAEEHVNAWLERGATDPSAGWTRDELSAHVRDEHSTFGWILEGMVDRAGFRIEDVHYDRSRIFAEYIARRDMA